MSSITPQLQLTSCTTATRPAPAPQPAANLDSFHMTLAKSYPKMRAPSFRPIRTGPTTCDVHYYSSNLGFSPFAIALLASVARGLFGIGITYEQTSERGDDCDHDIFKLTMPER